MFADLANWFSAAVHKMQPGMEPVEWDDRISALTSQCYGEKQRLKTFKTAVNHFPGTALDWQKTLSRAAPQGT